MTYANHAYSRGLPAFCRSSRTRGSAGRSSPTCPPVEADEYLDAAGQAGLDATLMVTPATRAGPD